MRWRGRDARLRLERFDDDKLEALREVDEVVVVGDDLGPTMRRHRLLPLHHFRIDRGVELRQIRPEHRRLRWIHLRKMLRDVARDDLRVDRIDHEMWIAERVHVAARAIERGGYFEHPDTLPCDDESDRKSTRLNSSHQIISYAV